MSTVHRTISFTGDVTRRSPLALVSATSFGVDAEVRGMERPTISGVPNYALRRVIVGTGIAVVVVAVAMMTLAAVGASAGFGGTPAAASEVPSAVSPATERGSGTGVAPTVHVAAPGDTFWSIADRYRGDVDHGRYVDVLIRLNDGTGVQAGQAVQLP